jgi:5-methyltetrahydrofolate--homocysteine methyltransferase
MDLLATLSARLQEGDDRAVRSVTEDAIAHGVPPAEILDRALLPGMAAVGARFRDREIFLPDVLLVARAMHGAMALLKPLLAARDVAPAGTVVLGTVTGDIHDIGKNLVAFMLQGAGFDVIDLGSDVPAERFVDTAIDRGATVIGMSALLTTTMSGMGEVVEIVRQRGLAGRVTTIVGGAPVSEAFAQEIGADAYACDAPTAVDRIRALAGRPHA